MVLTKRKYVWQPFIDPVQAVEDNKELIEELLGGFRKAKGRTMDKETKEQVHWRLMQDAGNYLRLYLKEKAKNAKLVAALELIRGGDWLPDRKQDEVGNGPFARIARQV